VIEVREDGEHPAHSAVLIRCAESGGVRGVVRGVDLALQVGQTTVVVDLGERQAADADLLSVLYRCGRRVRDSGGRFALVCVDSRLRRLFDVTLLSWSLPVYETQEEALAG
jgi:anti-anti-sigma factor